MSWQDLVNGAYEFLGAPFIFLSILRLHREKKVRGVSVLAVAFFSSWGVWNLYYYPHLGQWASFAGGCAIVLMNAIWLVQLAYYSAKEKNEEKEKSPRG